MTEMMTKSEAANLERLIRKQERVLKAACDQRAAELRAAFEDQISRLYNYNEDPRWKAAHNRVRALAEEADREVAEVSKELEIPKEFRPSINMNWCSRGQSAARERRQELRMKAIAEIDAMRKAARTKAESWSLEAQTELASLNLTTQAAKAFIEKMPDTGELMPALELDDVQQKLLVDREMRRW